MSNSTEGVADPTAGDVMRFIVIKRGIVGTYSQTNLRKSIPHKS